MEIPPPGHTQTPGELGPSAQPAIHHGVVLLAIQHRLPSNHHHHLPPDADLYPDLSTVRGPLPRHEPLVWGFMIGAGGLAPSDNLKSFDFHDQDGADRHEDPTTIANLGRVPLPRCRGLSILDMIVMSTFNDGPYGVVKAPA